MPAPNLENNPNRLSTVGENFDRSLSVLERWDKGASLQRMLEEPGMDIRVRNTLLTLFRRRASIDWLINDTASGRVKGKLRNLLRWGVCQIVHLEGIAPPVVVSFCVERAKKRVGVSQARFVNALLRRIADAEKSGTIASWLAKAPRPVRLELSEDLYKAWRSFLSPDFLRELGAQLQAPAQVTVRLREDYELPEHVQPHVIPLDGLAFTGSLRFFALNNPARFFALKDQWQGKFYVQDPATAMAPLMMQTQPGEYLGDLCAAPGGKSLILSEFLGPTGELLCGDRSSRRLPKLLENLEHAACPVEVVAADLTQHPFEKNTFDGVLLDVPCSNSGVIRRRPDVRWRYTRAKTRALCELQGEILEGVLPAVRPGGRIIYSTCSIDPDENDRQVRSLLERHPGCSLETEQQLYPGTVHDGAYAARIRVG